ncbi:MAG: BlaI/MecI/CopY family transcriptional regulator [Deltaproteobacteria bacterium]
MARPASPHPTELELVILKVLWRQAPRTVEEVRTELAANGRELTYSSVITIMNIMVRKRLLKRTRRGRAFYFEPLVAERRVSGQMLSDLVDRVFDGSARALMLRLLETSDVDDEELAAMRRMIQRIAREKKQ